MTRAVHPLCASGLWKPASVPFGSLSLSLRMSMRKWLIASDFSTNGLIVDSIRAFTVEGYILRAIAGQARASSLDTFTNSVTSRVPRSSMNWTPAPL